MSIATRYPYSCVARWSFLAALTAFPSLHLAVAEGEGTEPIIIIHKSGEEPKIQGGGEEPRADLNDEFSTLRRDLKNALKREARLNRDLEAVRAELATAVEDAERRKGKIAESIERFREMMKAQEKMEAMLRREQKLREQMEGKAEKLARLLQKSWKELARQEEKMLDKENEVQFLTQQLRSRTRSRQKRATDPESTRTVAGIGLEKTRLLDEANTLMREKRFEEAEALFRGGLERWPKESAFHIGLATLHYEQGDYETAESMMKDAQELVGESADANALLGMIAWRQDQLKSASRAFEKAIRLNPDDERCLIYYGMVMYGRGRHKEALAQLKNAVILDPLSSEAQFNMAVLLAGVDEPDFVEARTHYEEALRLGSEPDSALEKLLSEK